MCSKGLLAWAVVITIEVAMAYQYSQQVAREVNRTLGHVVRILGW